MDSSQECLWMSSMMGDLALVLKVTAAFQTRKTYSAVTYSVDWLIIRVFRWRCHNRVVSGTGGQVCNALHQLFLVIIKICVADCLMYIDYRKNVDGF